VATWNLENLFDADDDPVSTGDDEYLPHSWRRWTPARYAQKLTNAAHVVAALRPDVLCVQEVENRRVLQDLTTLLKTLSPACSLPHISHRDSGDARGIDVGLVSRFPIVRRELHQDIPGMRGALITTLDIDGAPLTVVTCHWKSWVGDAEANVVTRLREALAVRAEVDRLRAADPSSAIVVAGDFNDNHDGHSLQQGLAAYTDRDRVVNDREGRLLYNVLGELPTRDLGSYYYARRKVWNTFDALVIVPGMLAPPDVPGPPWRLAPSGAKPVTVFKRPEMLEADGRPKPFRRVRLKDGTDSYAEGYSDHLPIVVELVRAK
jgi:endonuclease/exonuclease/phosphatase family metal-dependent hydrolase